MPSSQKISSVYSLFDEVFTKGNLNYCDEIISSNVKFYDPAAQNYVKGLQAFKEREQGYQNAFPGKKANIDEIYESENKVIVRWSVSGKHSGDLPNIPATGNQVTVSGISILNFENGQITEINQSWDRLGLLEQLGQVQHEKACALN